PWYRHAQYRKGRPGHEVPHPHPQAKPGTPFEEYIGINACAAPAFAALQMKIIRHCCSRIGKREKSPFLYLLAYVANNYYRRSRGKITTMGNTAMEYSLRLLSLSIMGILLLMTGCDPPPPPPRHRPKRRSLYQPRTITCRCRSPPSHHPLLT